MKPLRAFLVILCVTLLPLPGSSQSASVEISQAGLNKIVTGLGGVSGGGSFRPRSPVLERGAREVLGIDTCEFVGIQLCPSDKKRPVGAFVVCKVKGSPERRILPAGPPVAWQWWISGSQFTMNAGSMSFTATFHSNVAGVENQVTKTVPATIGFDSASNRFNVQLAAWNENLVSADGATVATVNVAGHYNFSLPVQAQPVSVTLPNGSPRSLSPHVVSATPQYLAGKVVLNVEVGF